MATRARLRPFLVMLMLTLLAAGSAASQATPSGPVRLPRLFQDGMVLQRGAPIPVWGWAPPGTPVAVSFDGRTVRATADASGGWEVAFPAMQAGGPHALAVEGAGARLEVRDVLVGDVWVASGQSNMEWALSQATGGTEAAAAANDPLLREYAVPRTWSRRPEADLAGGSWAAATPANAGRFSAVAYYFARDLRAATGVPIGIIHTSWGGANVETWTSRAAQGITDSAWAAMEQEDRAREAAVAESLRERIGSLPATDGGMMDGRAAWADPALDDDGWTPLAVPGLWESAGFDGLDGVGWYRTTFTLSEAEARQGVRISLGMIDDNDITWINGVEVGRTEGYSKPRLYTVPATALQAGRNVLAVRVSDGAGGGGPYGDPSAFYVEAAGERRPLGGTWKFRVGAVSLQPDGQRINKVPSVLYNRMIHPLLRHPIRGVIWYQGESNANNDEQAAAYRSQFATLIRSWRREWRAGGGDFPFLWVQLPNFGTVDTAPPARAAWATLRESQAAALALPGTGQAVAIDVGDPADIHPLDKQPVGKRLALIARRVAYGEPVLASGPRYRRHTIRGGRVTVELDDVGGGLVSRTGEAVGGFAIAGADGRWVWAQARIDGDRVVVWSPEVAAPVAVRYAWSNSPAPPGLFNAEGLPAAPFRTDDW
jgi:sialate O-acetylesterase